MKNFNFICEELRNFLHAMSQLIVLEGVNGVNRLATKGEKILLTTDKTRKKLPTSDKKIN